MGGKEHKSLDNPGIFLLIGHIRYSGGKTDMDARRRDEHVE
jgi:hypothetical protein